MLYSNPNVDNSAYKQIFVNACRSSRTRNLANLIKKKKFRVNKSLSSWMQQLPLLTAIKQSSLDVASLLLDNGADPNLEEGYHRELPLRYAIKNQVDLELVRLLLDKGANPHGSSRGDLLWLAIESGRVDLVRLLLDRGYELSIYYQWPFRVAITRSGPENSEILLSIFDHAVHLADRQGGHVRTLAQYSQLGKAIIADDSLLVRELLGLGNYASYAGIIGTQFWPACLAVQFGASRTLEVFFGMDVDLEHIYWEAVRRGKLELVKRCNSREGFDPSVRNAKCGTALHDACSHGQLEVAKLLIDKYGLELQGTERDAQNHTPLFDVEKPEMLDGLLAAFPETNLHLRLNRISLLQHLQFRCDVYVVVLDNGGGPGLRSESMLHKCYEEGSCKVERNLLKMALIDRNYVSSVVDKILPVSLKYFNGLKSPDESECSAEIVKMQSIKINQSTSSVRARSLFDFMFFGANESARFSRNEIVLQLYQQNDQDFRNLFPQYGFALNYRLRRGSRRDELLESAQELLSFALGTGFPEEFGEMIFGSFSNNTLKHFKLDNEC